MSATAEITTLQDLLEGQEKRLAEVEAQLSTFTAAQGVVSKKIDSFQSRLASLTASCRDMKNDDLSSFAKYAAAQAARNHSRLELREHQKSLREIRQHIGRLQASAAEVRRSIARIRAELGKYGRVVPLFESGPRAPGPRRRPPDGER